MSASNTERAISACKARPEGAIATEWVKSTTMRSGAGYLCQFMPNHLKKRDYSIDQIDVFAAYVIPEDTWYLIPAVVLLGKRRKTMAMLCPVTRPAKKACYCYEGYREAWHLLTKSRSELLQYADKKTILKRRANKPRRKLKIRSKLSAKPSDGRTSDSTLSSSSLSKDGCPVSRAQPEREAGKSPDVSAALPTLSS